MKTNVLAAIKMTVVLLVLLAVAYPALVWAIAKMSPSGGMGDTLEHKGKKYYKNIGQSFTEDGYFWSRPSAVDYNAAGSAGSNKGPSNEEYLAEVKTRIDTFLIHNPDVPEAHIPVEMVTASGSGLDPDISPQGAAAQVSRVAKARGLDVEHVQALVKKHTQKPLWGLFGPEKNQCFGTKYCIGQRKQELSGNVC